MSKELILLMDPPQEVTERVAPEKTLQDSVLERWADCSRSPGGEHRRGRFGVRQ